MSSNLKQGNTSNSDESLSYSNQEQDLEKLKRENVILTNKVYLVLKDLFKELDKKKVYNRSLKQQGK